MTMTTPATLYQKLVASHTVAVLDEQNVLLFCDLHLMNEYTSPCLLYTSPSPRDVEESRMPSSA